MNALLALNPTHHFVAEALPATTHRLRSASMTDRSDEELMLAYASGDARAFDPLYERHRGPLFRFLLRAVKRRELADELFQETWGRVIQARVRYRVEAKFSTWLLQIAHNLVIDQHRRERPEDLGEVAENAFRVTENDERDRPDRVLGEFEQSRRLQDAITALPPDQRGAFLLRVENGLGIEEIGEVMGVGRETAKSRLRYALEKLRISLRSSE